jgi:hypothetical protein
VLLGLAVVGVVVTLALTSRKNRAARYPQQPGYPPQQQNYPPPGQYPPHQ